MKKIYVILISVIALSAVSCRTDDDYFRNPNEYMSIICSRSNYAVTVFENVWSSINTGYVFWDVTDVDWDQRYAEYKPKFEELDEKLADCTTDEEYGEVFIQEAETLYEGLLSGFKDGHMVVRVGISDTVYAQISPSSEYNKDRSHYDTYAAEFRNTFLAALGQNGRVSEFDSCFIDIPNVDHVAHASCIYTLSDGRKVPYLWNISFVEESSVQAFIASCQDPAQVETAEKWITIYDRFINNLVSIPKSELGGVILDLRANGGGSMAALPNYINIFAGEEHTYWETRYKEGMGRYDMSAWVPFEMGMPERYRDCAAEEIPIVVLCDVNSISCAEITTGSVKQMPTAHVIGERTWGGHGPLSGQTNSFFNETYGGVSGNKDMSMGYFVYTSNYENRPVGSTVLEGIGITPDEEVLYEDAGYQGQFDAAIRYLESLNM